MVAVTHPRTERPEEVLASSLLKEGEVCMDRDDFKRAVAFGSGKQAA